MRFPSLDVLVARAIAVLRRFPWTIAAGVIAAVAAINASHTHSDERLVRITFVVMLALPATIALTLAGETRRWSAVIRPGSQLVAIAVLALFYNSWPGPDDRADGVRYAQFSVALHLAVAFLPFLALHNRNAFWQYNRRLFLGFLRSGIFSGVIFVGIAIALVALEHLFNVDVASDTYLHIWFVTAFAVNTWLFLSTIPEDLEALGDDQEYPRALKVFAQYILTPLASAYLLILLAYLVKIVAGGEWPSGWIGWLVASVAVTGMLGYLLVEPLRTREGEGWIRVYARWLFLGLIPAALMLLAAFWKRIEPYGLTEPRTLGLLLGIWLLGTAVTFSVRPSTSIKTIPATLSLLLLVTLFGPVSVTQLSIASQGSRLARMLAQQDTEEGRAEASAALRFLIDHRAEGELARRLGKELPPIDWSTQSRYGPSRDSLGTRLMALAGARYQEQGYSNGSRTTFSYSFEDGQALAIDGYVWMASITAYDTTRRMIGPDSAQALPALNGFARVVVAHDTLAFDLHQLLTAYRDSLMISRGIPQAALRVTATHGNRSAALVLRSIDGKRSGDTLIVNHYDGRLLLK